VGPWHSALSCRASPVSFLRQILPSRLRGKPMTSFFRSMQWRENCAKSVLFRQVLSRLQPTIPPASKLRCNVAAKILPVRRDLGVGLPLLSHVLPHFGLRLLPRHRRHHLPPVPKFEHSNFARRGGRVHVTVGAGRARPPPSSRRATAATCGPSGSGIKAWGEAASLKQRE